MLKVPFRLLILIWLGSNLTGCFFLSNPLSAAGVREQHIDVMEQLNQKEHPGIIYVYESKVEPDREAHGGLGIPYKNMHRSAQKELVGNFPADAAFKAALYSPGNDSVNVPVAGKNEKFVLARGTKLELQRRYRTPAGYAAQALQLVAIPVDLAVSAVVVAGAVVLTPIAMITSSFRHSDHPAQAGGASNTPSPQVKSEAP